MSSRSYLENTILLCGESDHGKFLRTFSIKEMINAKGASVVCYAASYNNGGIGVLKEFYPVAVPSLQRNADGQLILDPNRKEDNETFDKLMQEYLEPFQMIQSLRRNPDLATFIPPFEIFYGCDESCHCIGTVYIWSPEPALETFENVCFDIHKNPSEKPEFNLVRVLYSIESLAKCICALHREGLIHRDIKPSNFGFIKRNGEILTQTITLFDVDTICSVYHVPDGFARGTEGYLEPQALQKKANNLSDLYSIGACLFHAIIVNDEVRETGYLYHPSFYPKLKAFVDTSELIQASEANAHPQLRSVLTRILQKTLGLRHERYQCCEELLSDVKKALDYVVPAEIAMRGAPGVRWVLNDVDKIRVLDSNREKNSTLALQYHLFMNPLYTDGCDEKKHMHVLVIGLGLYGTKFTDLVLQIAQMPGIRLHVTIVSLSLSDKEYYLGDRPELAKYFDADHSLPEQAESYGEIRFIVHRFSKTDQTENQAFLRELVSGQNGVPDYAFVATGNDERNLFIAGAIQAHCRTSFAWDGKPIAELLSDSLLPVNMSENCKTYPGFSEIERMAFNVHLIWNKNLNINFSDVRKEFRKPYNHNACVSFVLAMKYKLHAIKISYSEAAISETANAYDNLLREKPDCKRMLVYYEHRRWVTEKLCLGYRRIENPEECIDGNTRDEKLKRHVCICRSKVECKLTEPDWILPDGKINRTMWDNPTPEALSQLDELEYVSVMLHLAYLKHANSEKMDSFFSGEMMAAIKSRLAVDASSFVAFQELHTCMKDIWHGDPGQWKRYEGLHRAVLDTVKNADAFSEAERQTIQKLMEIIHQKFYPIWACQQYRDYKQDDIALVEGIPFILTYSDSLQMVIPYATGSNQDHFDNLSAPTVVNPFRIMYVSYCRSRQDLDAIKSTLPYLSGYMKKKEFRANVSFLIGCEANAHISNASDIEQDFQFLSEKRITNVKVFSGVTMLEFVSALKNYFMQRCRNKNNFLLEINSTFLSGVMAGSGLYQLFSSYSFNSRTMQFGDLHDCNMMKYLRVKPYITVTDMFALRKSISVTSNKPEFYADYDNLWKRYQSDSAAWKNLCRVLGEHGEKHDLIITFRKAEGDSGHTSILTYTTPFRCKEAIERIFQNLIEQKIIGAQSSISNSTSSSCTVAIHDFGQNSKAFDKLFYRIDLLMQTDFVYCNTDPKHHVVKICYNHLVVRDLDCTRLGARELDLLRFFHTMRYLISLTYDENTKKASFTFSTPQIKDLLTTEGRMLEVYTYHKAKETGAFDDIRSSFEIEWENNLGQNEFDCVLTKGFSSLFVECKATRQLKNEYYTKISRLAEVFGINVKIVLVADTQESTDAQAIYDEMREHGKQFDVITVSSRADIGNIGYKLLQIMNE